ncbi:MAG: OmpA family protein [Campylobacterota bacterium]|nr:OmpA family protein [Campylobacterota bacterium]
MKKVLLYSIVASSLLIGAESIIATDSTVDSANENNYEFTFSGGATSIRNDGSNHFKNGTAVLSVQNNEYKVKPRVDFTYIKIDDAEDSTVTSMTQLALHGVYNIGNEKAKIVPYVLGGVGYEWVEGERPGYESNGFIQAGAGVEYKINSEDEDSPKIKVETKALQIVGSDYDEGNEFTVTAGLAMPFGTGVQRDLNDNECPKKIEGPDQDRDGVLDSIDQCPNTPCDFEVDEKGCPIKAELDIHFRTDSSEVSAYSQNLIRNFAQFLLKNKGSMVSLTGHTDFRGSDAYNMALSHRRANSVQTALVQLGVSTNRLSADGKGESQPIATNSTAEGMAKNRRTEVRLTYPASLMK